MIWESSVYFDTCYGDSGNGDLCMDVARHYMGLKRVVIGAFGINRDEFQSLLYQGSPGIEFLDIRDENLTLKEIKGFVQQFTQLERLILPVIVILKFINTCDPFEFHHPALKVVEYHEPTNEQVEEVLKFGTQSFVLWDDIVNAHPESSLSS